MTQHLFIIGLHRSTTTLMTAILNKHTQISTLHDPETGWTFEGIFKNKVYGMPKQANGKNDGVFAFNLENHWGVDHPLCNEATKQRLLDDWGKYWDHSAPYLLEKSPPHLTRVGFLDGLFPESKYIHVVRHPLVVGIAAMQWSKIEGDATLEQRVRHSAYCLKVAKDQLERYAKGRYIRLRHEEFCINTGGVLADVQNFIGVDPEDVIPPDGSPTRYRNFEYLQQYKQGLHPIPDSVIKGYESTLNAFGYSFFEPFVLSRPYPGITYLG